MRLKWLRTIWALAAFVPVAMLATPVFPYSFVLPLCAMYLWPATWAAQQLGIAALTPQYAVIAALYCAAVGGLAAITLSRLLRLPAYIERQNAIVLIAIVWGPIALFAGVQVLRYQGVFAIETACPVQMYVLQPHCKDITDFREHEINGFIDTNYVATLRLSPGTLSAIAAANQMKEISPADVPASFWSQPPFWWTIRRPAAARVYMTPAFSFEGRGQDGDHYLFIEERETNKVFVYFQNNF